MLTVDQQLHLIKEANDLCYTAGIFTDAGAELSYLTQAILSNRKCELSPVGPLAKILKANVAENHLVWQFIALDPSVVCINCEMEVLLDNASYCPPLNGWLGHNCCVDAGETEGYYEEVSVA